MFKTRLTLNSILSDIKTKLAQLDSFISDQNNRIDDIDLRVAELNVERMAIREDVEKATTVRHRLATLIAE